MQLFAGTPALVSIENIFEALKERSRTFEIEAGAVL
jgi:hypothetical protein